MKVMKGKIRQVLALLLIVAMVVTTIQISPVQAQAAKKGNLMTTYDGDGYTVTFRVTSQWSGAFNADVTITNTSDKVIDNWALGFAMPYEITKIWNGVIHSKDNGLYVIKNADSKQDIAIGKSAKFGFSAKVDGELVLPSSYDMLCSEEMVDEGAYEVSFKTTSDWKSAFNGEIRIKNISEVTIEDWKLEFDIDHNIDRFWTAEIIKQEGNHYSIKNAGYNANIKPGETVVLGFDGKPGNVINEPTNYELFQIVNEKALDINDEQGKTWEEMLDSDKDGLPDEEENDFGTDYLNSDTDGDGLPDGYELLYSNTDPLNPVTLGNGITDDKLDPDHDNLNIAEEYQMSTDPLDPDTDLDGLLDGEEIKIYHTNPLLYDTDGDGLCDGDEVALGLDPLNPYTDGQPDSQHESTQVFNSDSKALSVFNKNNKEYQIELEAVVKGSINRDLYVRKSAYSEVVNNLAILGDIPELIIGDQSKLNSITLHAVISDKNIYPEYSCVELKGIKRYQFFKFYEECNLLLPIETEYDELNHKIFAKVDEDGTYCIVDLEKWLSSIGINIAPDQNNEINMLIRKTVISKKGEEQQDENKMTAIQQPSLQTLAYVKAPYKFNETVSDEAGYNKDVVDMVFMLNTDVEGLSNDAFKGIQQNIAQIAKKIFYESKSARIHILDPNGKSVKTIFGQDYATNEYQVNSMISNMRNERPSVPYLDDQYKAAINSVNYQPNSTKIAVIIGNAYCTMESFNLIAPLAAAKIYTCVVHPNTQEDSLYYTTAKETSGILVYDYAEFDDDIVQFLYGYVPKVPQTKFMIISSTGLKSITLKADLNPTNGNDSDLDGLTDWAEVNQKYITFDSDGDIILPTFSEYTSILLPEITKSLNSLKRIMGLPTYEGATVSNLFAGIRILPIISDPTSHDGDNDGILDIDETTWDGIDERYKNIGPLHEDTIETLFYKLTDSSGTNKVGDPSYLEISGNDVTLHLLVDFGGDEDKDATTALNTTYSTTDNETESKAIIARLGSSYTFKDILIDGIKQRWSGTYLGNEYDFYKGMKVNFNIDIQEVEYTWTQKAIVVRVKDGKCGVCNQSGVNWKSNSIRRITMYNSYCDKSTFLHHSGRGNCKTYADGLYTIAKYEGVAAHEFGHVFGLDDMYANASTNHGYEPKSANEISYDINYFALPQAKGIMKSNGCALANDIEMILTAFEENTWQYFVPAKKQKISNAIKETQSYYCANDKKYYTWDDTNSTFK